MLNFSASMFFVLMICSISIVNTLKGEALKVKRSEPEVHNCLFPNKIISDCSKFSNWSKDESYFNGNRVIIDGYLFQLVIPKSVSPPATEGKLCSQIQDCIIWDIEWMLLGECQNINVDSDMMNQASSKTITDELDI